MKTNKNHPNHRYISKALRPVSTATVQREDARAADEEAEAHGRDGRGSPKVASSEQPNQDLNTCSDLCWALCCPFPPLPRLLDGRAD